MCSIPRRKDGNMLKILLKKCFSFPFFFVFICHEYHTASLNIFQQIRFLCYKKYIYFTATFHRQTLNEISTWTCNSLYFSFSISMNKQQHFYTIHNRAILLNQQKSSSLPYFIFYYSFSSIRYVHTTRNKLCYITQIILQHSPSSSSLNSFMFCCPQK